VTIRPLITCSFDCTTFLSWSDSSCHATPSYLGPTIPVRIPCELPMHVTFSWDLPLQVAIFASCLYCELPFLHKFIVSCLYELPLQVAFVSCLCKLPLRVAFASCLYRKPPLLDSGYGETLINRSLLCEEISKEDLVKIHQLDYQGRPFQDRAMAR
jgi:hypothetical protein